MYVYSTNTHSWNVNYRRVILINAHRKRNLLHSGPLGHGLWWLACETSVEIVQCCAIAQYATCALQVHVLRVDYCAIPNLPSDLHMQAYYCQMVAARERASDIFLFLPKVS